MIVECFNIGTVNFNLLRLTLVRFSRTELRIHLPDGRRKVGGSSRSLSIIVVVVQVAALKINDQVDLAR